MGVAQSCGLTESHRCGQCKFLGDRDTEDRDPPVALQHPCFDELGSEPSWQPEERPYVLPPGGQLTVLLFGMTGAGKSSLGNLIAGCEVFGTDDTTRSVTNMQSITRFEAEDDSLIVLDTTGLGDTEITQEKVCSSIRDVVASAPFGVDMFCYVMHVGRMTDDTVSRLVYLTQYLWGDESLMNLYIVITWASRYVMDRTAGEAWIQTQVESDPRFRHIHDLVGNNPDRFIFVDNPPYDGSRWQHVVDEKRRISRETLLKAFCQHPRDLVPAFVSRAVPTVISEALQNDRNMLQEKQLQVARIRNALRSDTRDLNFQQLLRESSDADESQEAQQGTKTTKAAKETPRKVSANSPRKVEEKGAKRKSDNSPDTSPKPAGKAKQSPRRNSAEKSPRTPKEPSPRDKTSSGIGQTSTTEPVKKETGHQKLQAALEKAQNDVEESKKKIDDAMIRVKSDENFKKIVNNNVADSTARFQKDCSPIEAGKGKSQMFRAKGFFKSVGRSMFGGSKKADVSKEESLQGLLSRSAERLRAPLATNACIIFDWDDTLCPTTWLQTVLQPTLDHVPKGHYQQEISAIVRELEETLRTACQIAHVDILTQSNVYWVRQSLEYLRLSGVDVEAVLKDLNITFHYADIETAAKAPAKQKGGLDISTFAKKVSITKILNTRFGDSPKTIWNAMSIGDRNIELDALREVCKERQRRTWRRPICKTVKLPENPELEDLVKTLQVLTSHLHPLVEQEKNLDITFNPRSNTLIGA